MFKRDQTLTRFQGFKKNYPIIYKINNLDKDQIESQSFRLSVEKLIGFALSMLRDWL